VFIVSFAFCRRVTAGGFLFGFALLDEFFEIDEVIKHTPSDFHAA